MISANPLNVYTGPKSLQDYHDPEKQPLLPLVEIPDCLNPFREYNVRIYAKMMTMLPAHNVKALPALNMLSSTVEPDKTKTIVEYSSGSTVISMSIIGRVFHGIHDTRAYLSNKTSSTKLRLMRFFGLDITLFGGPSQPEPCDPRGGIQVAGKDAEENEEIANPNQYENDANWEAHYRWTGPQITKQLPQVNVICAGMGTSGTMTGMGTFFKERKPSVTLVACCTAPGQRVPGPRSQALMGPVDFPWRDAVDQIEEVGEMESYSLSMKLSREGLICGPSSGFNLKGLCQMLERRKNSGTLDALRNSDGSIHCVFICCDLPYQYIDEYFSKLDETSFPPLHNSNLTKVDLHRYDEAWELKATDALARVYGFSSGPSNEIDVPQALDALFRGNTPPTPFEAQSVLLDLRTRCDFDRWSFPFSRNLELRSLDAGTDSPFKHAAILEKQWLELDALFKADSSLMGELQGKNVLTLCYDGDTSRVATSLLRAKGVDACSLRGGLRGLFEKWPSPMAGIESEESPKAADNKATVKPHVRVYESTDILEKPELPAPVVA